MEKITGGHKGPLSQKAQPLLPQSVGESLLYQLEFTPHRLVCGLRPYLTDGLSPRKARPSREECSHTCMRGSDFEYLKGLIPQPRLEISPSLPPTQQIFLHRLRLPLRGLERKAEHAGRVFVQHRLYLAWFDAVFQHELNEHAQALPGGRVVQLAEIGG